MVCMKEITLVTCSYNTPEVTMGLLKSFYFHHKTLINRFNIVLMENSSNDDTAKLLDENNIPYHRRFNCTHSIGVDEALTLVKTKYALLLDTDVLFHKPITNVYNVFRTQNVVSLGKVMGSRGGYKLVPRVFPWFNMLDMEQINKHGIRFHNQEKIDKSGSNGFFGNLPIQQNEGKLYYDVGSSFLEEVLENRLLVHNVDFENNIFTHYEGMSWQRTANTGWYSLNGNNVYNRYVMDCVKYQSCDIRGRYV